MSAKTKRTGTEKPATEKPEEKKAAVEKHVVNADAENAKSETGKAKAESGKAKAESGKAKAESGKAKSETGKAKSETGKAKAETGKAKAETGKAKAETGKAKAETGKAKSETGNAVAETKKAKSESGKAKSESGKPVAEIRGGAVYVLQPGTRVYVKTADLCAMTGKSNQWIGQLTSQGVLFKKRTARGNMYEIHDAVSSYVARLDKRNVQDQTKDDLEKQKLSAEIDLKEAKAAISRFDVEERRGNMHRSEDVAAMTEDLIFAIRGELLALPGRLALNLVGVETAAQAAEIVRKEVSLAMENLSEYRYDPQKYRERVRRRMRLEALTENEDGEDA